MGNTICYYYEALHRVTQVLHPGGGYASVTDNRCFVYDGATVDGQSMQNAKGRLAEAYTAAHGGGCTGAKVTDLGFSYTARGEVSDTYESTPHSNGYYHVSATYWPHGLVNTLTGLGLPQITYGVGEEGRVDAVTAASGQSPATSILYNNASQVTSISYGSGDSDAFQYDPNTGRMTQYKYVVNGQSVVGNLTWNANGTLEKLAITDPFNSANQQTCNYAYDDLARINSVDCLQGSTHIWTQTFSIGVFENLQKTGSNGGITFYPGYDQYTNHMTILGSQTVTATFTEGSVLLQHQVGLNLTVQ